MTNVIGVRFPSGNRIYYFDPGQFNYDNATAVIVETSRGIEFAELVQKPHEVEDNLVVQPLKTIERIATEEDIRRRQKNAEKEVDAFRICQEKIKNRELDMKLVGVEFSFDNSKVVFYFTADERVDFRELVKDLASEFKTRIELRQIGVRDEAKLLGGLGPCGRPVCCKAFLDDFRPVSIKMAKEQNLSLSPTKISGLCGRLMCCLQYEESTYEETRKKMPKVGKEIQTPKGKGTVMENNAVTERTKVKIIQEDGTITFFDFHYTELGDNPIVDPEKVEKKETTVEEVPAVKNAPVGDYIPPEIKKENISNASDQQDRKPNKKNRWDRFRGNNKQRNHSENSSNQGEKSSDSSSADNKQQGVDQNKKSHKHFYRNHKKKGNGPKPQNSAPQNG